MTDTVKGILIGIGVAAIGVAGYVVGTMVFAPQEEERPPIVISDGSITFDNEKTSDGKDIAWRMPVTGNKKRWKHAHGGRAENVESFTIDGFVDMGSCGGSRDRIDGVQSIFVAYRDGADTHAFTIHADLERPQHRGIVLDGTVDLTPHDQDKTVVQHTGGGYIEAVLFAGETTKWCTFTASSPKKRFTVTPVTK